MEKGTISGHTRLAGFFASPSTHSLSPKMHNLSFQEQGIDCVYLAFNVSDHLATSIEAIRSLNMVGVNISMPNKIEAIAFMDELSEEATLIGAINTVVHQEGKLIGYNTDGIGFCQSLLAEGIAIRGTKMTMLGSGGAAVAMVCQAALEGMEEITIFSRRSPRFDAMEQKIATLSQVTTCKILLYEWDQQDELKLAIEHSNLLVNATSIGMEEEQSPIENPVFLRSDLVVYDVIYDPTETKLLKQAKAVGAKTVNGLGMLIYQGAESFRLWTGKKMPVEKVKALLEQN